MVSGPASDLLREGISRLEAASIPADEARGEARILLCRALSISHESLRMNPDRNVSAEEGARYEILIARRARREPLAYITGEREFYGLTLRVTPDVLIPRPETEFVVEAALRRLQEHANPGIADVGTGSGAIAVALAHRLPGATVFASDISAAALDVARENARLHGVDERVIFAQGDFLDPVKSSAPFDAIVSNPPYIGVDEMDGLMPEVRDWEPQVALGTHPDSLHFYRRFAGEAPALLAPGGFLIVEVGQGQSGDVALLWREAGLADTDVIRDYAGIARVVCGCLPK